MTRIRKLYYFDKKNTREMISFLNNEDAYVNYIMFNPFIPLHNLLPVKYKFLPESYILKDKKNIKGLITVAPSRCPTSKMEIQRLLFEENCYEDAGALIQFVVSKYRAKGVISFIVRVDDYLPELVKLFVARCGFTQISYEKLWKIETKEINNYNINAYREFRNSDAQTIATLYNESLLPHFRQLLQADKNEFREVLFKGLSYFSEYQFIIENDKNILGYISIKTSDNKNYILDVIKPSWTELNLEEIFSFANAQIQKRSTKYNLFYKTKKYTQMGEKIEQIFFEHKFKCVQNQVVLTNSSARIIKDPVANKGFNSISHFYTGIGVNIFNKKGNL